jgi:hypothetical protein
MGNENRACDDDQNTCVLNHHRIGGEWAGN